MSSAPGWTVAFYVDASIIPNGTYTDPEDFLRVFQGGSTPVATGEFSSPTSDDFFVDIYTTSGLGNVLALSNVSAAANTVFIV